jgi:UDP-2-acetamido-3-amino-2,3-dideoxy-glucuronate N-acetyltransferase
LRTFNGIYQYIQPPSGDRQDGPGATHPGEKGATIGANATIICGVTLGRYSFIGAGAVVNKNICDYALVVGNPARQIGWACECGERLPDDLECLICGKQYEKGPTGLVTVKN